MATYQMLENLVIKMEKFKNIKSIPAHISLMNIDTDKIIPKQFLKTIKRSGLGKNLFYEMRFDEKGKPISGFILDTALIILFFSEEVLNEI